MFLTERLRGKSMELLKHYFQDIVVNRRHFLKCIGLGTTGLIGSASHRVIAFETDNKSVNTSTSKKNGFSVTYSLPWLSNKYCPDFQDIGIGIGCLKVIGNTQFSFPLCPGVQLLPKANDPVRRTWQP